jgi:hypothetical protein
MTVDVRSGNPSRYSGRLSFAVGVELAAVLTVATVIYPALGLPILLAAVALSLAFLVLNTSSPPRWSLVSGLLVGVGGVFLLGSGAGIATCWASGMCGQDGLFPLLQVALGALAALTLGGLAAARAISSRPRGALKFRR